jgi:hypothetical protein
MNHSNDLYFDDLSELVSLNRYLNIPIEIGRKYIDMQYVIYECIDELKNIKLVNNDNSESIIDVKVLTNGVTKFYSTNNGILISKWDSEYRLFTNHLIAEYQ